MNPQRHVQQLKGTAGDIATIDVTSANRVATFRLENIEPKLGSHWCYAQKIRVYWRTQIDQPAAGGSIIRADQWFRALSSIKLSCDDLGVIYQPGDINGPALGLIAQVVSNGYSMPYLLRDDVPAADGDTPVTFVFDIPLAHRCFTKGHQTGIWNGFLRNAGILEITLADSTALAAVSTGSALEAVTDLRCELVYTAEPEARPPTIWHWRMRDTPANETKHTIRNLCQGAGIKGASGAGKIAFLAYLSNLAGLGGAGAIDNIQRVYLRDRGSVNHDLGTPFFGTASYISAFVEATRREAIFPSVLGHSYPYQLGTQVNGAPNAATTLFLPYFWPEVYGQDVSKLQEWSGDYYLEHSYTATPAAVARWLTLEQSYLDASHEEFLMRERMGLPPERFTSYPKVKVLSDPGDEIGVAQQQRKLRGIPKKIRARRS
jgi:hypothetical protein